MRLELLLVIISSSVMGAPDRSDVEQAFSFQTRAKHQGYRLTCSAFALTAMVEAYLVRDGLSDATVDLSEQYMQYIASLDRPDETSFAKDNIEKMRLFGISKESLLPYNPRAWDNKSLDARKYCGHLTGPGLLSCIAGQRDPQLAHVPDQDLLNPTSLYFDPEFQVARNSALQLAREFGSRIAGAEVLASSDQAKEVLARGEFLILELDFYCGAWNHPCAERLGIGQDKEAQRRGEVGFPAPGSYDQLLYSTEPSRHSVLIIGYDDTIETRTKTKSIDGLMREYSYKGVYYIKNSLSQFGSKFVFKDKSYPGFGTITQEYAHKFGQFVRINWKATPQAKLP